MAADSVPNPWPATLARFWAAVLDYAVAYSLPHEIAIEPRDESNPALVFVSVLDAQSVKNRLHLDLNPADQAAEVERLLGLGARRVDVGQGADAAWVVLADPEGNKFCVLTARDPT